MIWFRIRRRAPRLQNEGRGTESQRAGPSYPALHRSTDMKSRIHRLAGLAAVSLAAGACLAGCADDPVGALSGDPVAGNALEQIDLDEPYGGLAYTNEPAAFGEASLQAEAQLEMSAEGQLDDDEQLLAARFGEVRSLLSGEELRRTYVRIVWGMLEGEHDSLQSELAPLDWTGGLSVSDGALVVKRTILFERRLQDDHLLPRDNRQEVAWVSHTGRHVDGIVVCVLSRPDSLGEVAGTLTFQTPQLSRAFDIALLDGLDETVLTDDRGNGVHFSAVAREPLACPTGFMAGRWLHVPDTAGGLFRGLWLTDSGRVRGFVMGRFGENGAGEHVFAGKLIALDGRIRGLCQGTYAPSGDGTGTYEGHWANRAGTRLGVMAGRYLSRPAVSAERPAAGFFQGRWHEICQEPSAL